MKRRDFLTLLGSVAGAGATGSALSATAEAPPDAKEFSAYPFTLGVASGDPSDSSVVLWTRLAPDPLHGGGMPDTVVPVEWAMAEDPGMKLVIQSGMTMASPDLAHSVHVTVSGLQAGKWYYYRFWSGAAKSRVGRTRTLPARMSDVSRLAFAVANCQEYEFGYYTAYRHMAGEDIDFVLHLGDYIYESDHIVPQLDPVRRHNTGKINTLEEYRNRHALYRLDPDLQAAHAALPFIQVWDDHEVDNDWAGTTPADPDKQSTEKFMARRAIAARAFYEHVPLADRSRPRHGDMQLYRRIDLGNLATINLLDTRQYRSDQPCGTSPRRNPPVLDDCEDRLDPSLTMTGEQQEAWLLQNLQQSQTRWNVIAQPGWFSQFRYRGADGEIQLNMDQWDGYPVQRQRLIDFMAENKLNNMVMLSGDWHINGVMDVKRDFDNPDSPTVASEFGVTSISSVGPWGGITKAQMPLNPHVKYIAGDDLQRGLDVHGYVVCRVTAGEWHTEFRVLETVKKPNQPIHTAATFSVKSGQPGAVRS